VNILEILAQKIVYCQRIRNELEFSYSWISKEPINGDWVKDMDNDPLKKERVSAFCGRFGKLQDYFSDKLLKTWVEAVGEKVGVAIENFSAAERAGILTIKSEDVFGLRSLRNDLMHDYIEDHNLFAEKLCAAIESTKDLFGMFDNLRLYSIKRLGVDTNICDKGNSVPKSSGSKIKA
jgi:hypothetical protein